jgi:PAS domain S-box-containing protein
MDSKRRASEHKRRTVGLSDAHLALAQQLAHVGSWELDLANLEDLNSNPLRWSDETFRLLGYVPGEIEPSNDLFFKAVHPDDRENIRQAVDRAVHDCLPYNIEHRVLWPDGTERILHEQSTIVYADDGRPVKMLGVVQDVTQRKKAVAHLELQAAILARLDEAVIVSDLHGRILSWNSGAESLFGFNRVEMLGQSLSRIYPSDQVDNLHDQLEEIQKGKRIDSEWEGLCRDGTRVWLQVRIMVFKDIYGGVSGLLSFARNITRQKREAEAIRQSEQLYRAVGESVNFGVWTCNPKGRLTHMSDSFMKMLGLTSAQSLGDGWMNAINPDEREGVMQAWRASLKTDKPWNQRYRVLGADGRYHPVITYGAPVRNQEGRVLCWAGLNLDAEHLQ